MKFAFKPIGRQRVTPPNAKKADFAVFAVMAGNYSERLLIFGGNPGLPPIGDENNSATPAVIFAVFRCSFCENSEIK